MRTVQYIRKTHLKYKREKCLSFKNLLLSAIVLVVVIILFVCILGLFNANASDNRKNQEVNRHYSSIIIQPKDNLWGIAEKYAQNESISTYIDNIKKLNNMDEDTVYAGNSIIIYYYD